MSEESKQYTAKEIVDDLNRSIFFLVTGESDRKANEPAFRLVEFWINLSVEGKIYALEKQAGK